MTEAAPVLPLDCEPSRPDESSLGPLARLLTRLAEELTTEPAEPTDATLGWPGPHF